MAEFKLVPVMVGTTPYFEVRRWEPGLIWGGHWKYETIVPTRAEADNVIRHLGGPITTISTEGKSGSESK